MDLFTWIPAPSSRTIFSKVCGRREDGLEEVVMVHLLIFPHLPSPSLPIEHIIHPHHPPLHPPQPPFHLPEPKSSTFPPAFLYSRFLFWKNISSGEDEDEKGIETSIRVVGCLRGDAGCMVMHFWFDKRERRKKWKGKGSVEWGGGNEEARRAEWNVSERAQMCKKTWIISNVHRSLSKEYNICRDP